MNIFAPFAKTTNKSLSPSQPTSSARYIATPFLMNSALNFYGRGSYDNNYANINRIAETISTVIPYAVDADGEEIEGELPLINALRHPNNRMSVIKFIKSLTVLALVYPYVPVLVWHMEGNELVPGADGLTPDNIAGFTFLEGYECQTLNGELVYIDLENNKHYNDRDVLRISLDVNPYNLTEGYSPTIAAKKWSSVDDYLVDYQAGFFKNHTRPEGIFIIDAPDENAFNEAVDKIEKKHKGAGKNDNVIYVPRTIDPITRQEGAAAVQWIPLASNNKDLALKDVFAQAERVRDMTFGVPAELKGYLSNSNYASVMMAERIYDKYVILPKLTMLWSEFTHELNRITGGLGFALSFDYEVQSIAEDEKVITERKQAEYDLYKQAILDGNDPEEVCDSLDLPTALTNLEFEPKSDGQAQTESAEDEQKTEQKDAKSRISHGSVRSLEKALSPEELREIEEYERVINDALKAEVDAAENEDENERNARIDALKTALYALIVAKMGDAGVKEYAQAKAMALRAGITLGGSYSLSDKTQEDYRKQLDDAVDGFMSDTATSIERVKGQAETEGWNDAERATAIAGIVTADAWRVRRLANSEQHRAYELAQEDAYLQAQGELEREGLGAAHYYKTWHCLAGACKLCASLDSMRIPVEDSFPDIDDWGENIAHAHPHCRCYLEFDIDVAEKSVKVDCPGCGLFLTEGKHASLEKLKCNRCKKWYSVEIEKGKAVAKEVQK